MNKFAKYVPEEDKKKQREFIGIDLNNMGGSVEDLFVNDKELVLFDGVDIELDTEGTWTGKPNGVPRTDKEYVLICDGIEYSLGSPIKGEGQYGRPLFTFNIPEDCPLDIAFMFVVDSEYNATYKPIIGASARENGTYSFKIVSPGNNTESVYENHVEYQYNYYNDEFKGIKGTDNVTHFCVDRMIGGWIYIPLDVIPKPEEFIGATVFRAEANNFTVTDDMLYAGETCSYLMPGLKYVITDDESREYRFAIGVCDGEESWFGPGLYITHNYSGIAWGEQTQAKTIDQKYLPAIPPTIIYIGEDSRLYEDEALTTQLSYTKALALASDPNLIIYWNVDETYYRPVRVMTSGISVQFLVSTDEGLARYQVYDPNAGPV